MTDLLKLQNDIQRRSQRKIWDSAPFLEEFCSHITAPMKDVGGGAVYFAAACEYVSSCIASGVIEASIGEQAGPTVRALQSSMESRILFYRKLAALEQWGSDYHLSRMVTEVSYMISSLEPGAFVLIPATAPSGPVVLLVEAEDDRMCRLVVINPSPYAIMHRKTMVESSTEAGGSSAGSQGSSKILQNIAMPLALARRSRLANEAFWFFVLGKISQTDDLFYQHLLTWATEKDFEGQTAEGLETVVPATPSKSPKGTGGYWKPFVHALRYLLHTRANMNKRDIKHVRFFLRKFFIKKLEDELAEAQKITLTQKKLMESALGTLSLAAARSSSTFSLGFLDGVREDVERITRTIGNLPVKGEVSASADEQPLLDVTSGWDRAQQPDLYPLFDMFRRLDSVEEFVGVKEEQTKATPINFFRFRESVETIQDVTVALSDVVQLLVRVSAHASNNAVKNASFLAFAAISHMVIEVLPPPLGVLTKNKTGRSTLWDTPVTYAQQVHLLTKLQEVSYFFHWSYKCTDSHRDADPIHMVVLSALSAMADNVIRIPAVDIVSVVTEHLNGNHHMQGNSGGFSVSAGALMAQTEISTFTYPEALLTRSAVLDYFDELVRFHPASNVVLKMEEGATNAGKEIALSKMLKQIATAESFPPHSFPTALEYVVEETAGQSSFLNRYYPEFRLWRDVVGLAKVATTQQGGLHQNGGLLAQLPGVESFRTAQSSLVMTIVHDNKAEPRFTSDADVNGYIDTGKKFATEDDILHIQNLPSFGILGQRDTELLFSYLTAPYLRIPLILRFFATEDRVSSLTDDSLCTLLHSVLFEPGRFLSIGVADDCPVEVPTEQVQLIATPNGLLVNELQCSPKGVIDPLLKLLRLVKEMDAGTVFNESITKIVLMLTRIVSHVESYLFMVIHHRGRLDIHREERSFVVLPEELAYLQEAHVTMRSVIDDELLPMLDSWVDELNVAIDKNELSNLDPSTASSMLSGLHLHIVLLLRNVEPSQYTTDFVSRMLSSFAFLTTRFVWGRHIHFNEHEVYSALQKHRRQIAHWLYARTAEEIGMVMNSVVRVATGSGLRVDLEATNYPWGFVAGRDCTGRFMRADAECMNRKGAAEGKDELLEDLRKTLPGLPRTSYCEQAPTIQAGLHEVEVSLHSGSLTFKAAFLKAIPQEIANDNDFRFLFEQQLRKTRVNPEAMQCAVVEEASNRLWIQLVGLEHDVQFWRTHDPRVPIPSDSMRFYPDDCEFTEKWIAPIFELYRRAFFQRSFFQPPILILLPEEKLTDDASVAMLTAVCSATGEKLKEVYVFRDLHAVHIFDVVSHGRRFYRQHVFYSDVETSFKEDGDSGSYGDGTADRNCGVSQSAVILRRPTHPKNLSRSVETYIPPRFLQGLLPDALIAICTFWQDEDDNIRGYPTDRKATHLYWLHWKDLRYAPLGSNSIGVQVFRFSVAGAAPRASEQAVLKSQRIELADECDDEISMSRAARTDSHDGAPLQEAGMYRQSSVVHEVKPDSATIEDHNLLLLNLMFARAGTPLHSLAKVITRLEPLAHVLVWTAQTDYDTINGGPATIDLIHLPRLKLSFRAKLLPDSATYAIFSLDHAHLCISNSRPGPVMTMTRGIPHSMIMADPNDTLTLLVPRFSVVRRDSRSPFSVDVIVCRNSQPHWYSDTCKYYLFPVHISQMFLFTPSYSSAVYLLLLRYLNRNYVESYRLVASVGTDEAIDYDVKTNIDAVMAVQDSHPDAVACMARMTLYVGGKGVPWDVAQLVAHHVRLHSRTSVSCLMPPEEELRLVEFAWQGEERLRVVRTAIKQNSAMMDNQRRRGYTKELYRLAAKAIRDDLGTRLEEHKVAALFDKAMSNALEPFDRCLVVNRRLLLLSEQELLLSGQSSKTVRFEVPVMPEDPRLLFYSEYDPTSITAEPERHMNDQGKQMFLSPSHDFYYCNSTKREFKCKCGFACREICGGASKDGCPCYSCERFNREKRNTLRALPLAVENKNPTRPMPFMELSALIRQVAGSYINRLQRQKGLPEPCSYHSEPITLRNGVNGFYTLYEMCTGTRACKIGKRSVGKEIVQLILPMYFDGIDVGSALSHMMQYISRLDKENLAQLPQFSKKVRSMHLVEIHEALVAIIAETDAEGRAHPQPASLATMPKYKNDEDLRNDGIRTVSIQPRRATRDASIPLSHTRILPAPLNCDCSLQVVELPHPPHLQLRGDEQATLSMQSSELEDLTGWPLRSILDGESSPLVFRDRAQLNLEAISSSLPFDLTVHPDATMSVAKEMLERLTHEMSSFAKRSNDAKNPKLTGLETEREARTLLRTALGVESSPALETALKNLQRVLSELKEGLLRLRAADNTYVAYANEVVLRTANFYSHETLDGLVLTLRSVANREPHLKMEYLLSALCSTTCTDEWLQLNPFLTPESCLAMKHAMVVSVLRANRAGHINRILEVLRELQSFFLRASQLSGSAAAISHLDAFVASVAQKADTLASLLAVKKCYFTSAPPQPSGNFAVAYDPRHLLFEFTWNLMMRKRQHELIGDMHDAVTRGDSVVKQMIMGAGKTTVVSPVLGLMLANGRQLMVQIVPPALLDFTRAVLRTTFSSILQKQIFTFICDRNTAIDSDIQAKFEEAIQSRGIVLTTPSSVKSLFLKSVESCRRATQPSLPIAERVNLLRDTNDHLQILKMWKDAVLVMDEVDMLLHPLKSELNFPIGAKKELDFQPIRWKLPIHLLDIIYAYHARRLSTHMRDAPEAPGIVTKFRDAVSKGLKQNVLQEMPHLILLNSAYYEAEIKPVLVEWLMLFVRAQHLLGLTDDETKNYIYERPTKKKEPELVAKIEALDPYHIKVLNLSYEWINSYLPHILQKIDRVTFGIMTQREYYDNQGLGQSRSRLVTAIPFVGKDMPSPSSEFAHPDIVIGLTVLAYRYEGLRETDFHLIMQEIFGAVEREVGRFSQRRTTILYNKWVASAGGSILTTFDYQATRAKFNQDLDDDMAMQPSESICLISDGLHHGMELNYSDSTKEADGMVTSGSVVMSSDQRNVLPLKLMKQANELEMKKLYKLFRRTPEVIHWYLTEHVFPEHMRHQEVKLSASGQELGGDMLFQRRIGFSGTPSSLLPVELGQCGYEVGTDGQLIHTLTSPDIMSHSVMPSGWNVRTILDVVASATPPFHALIDTGALITGMSNLQVAEYLLKTGLPQMEGVVYLDEEDRKMILVRATGRSLPLSECGIPKVKRFAFYDQIHTTGMDIEHTPNAQAVQTLGKDMTFRDFSQGAYRMRGIGQGQTIHLLIIPEVEDLVFGVMRCVKGFTGKSMKDAASSHVLVGVTAWLMVNSIRSEHMQHNQLRVQCCSNVWRKEAFRSAVNALSTYNPALNENGVPLKTDDLTEVPDLLSRAVQVFDEELDYQVISYVPQPRMFSEMLVEHVQGHDAFIIGTGRDVIASIIDSSRREDEMDAPVIDVEMVQEQEEEREREEQKEQEEEIEIEKFVDHDYSREFESSMPWRVDILRTFASGMHQFYPLREFHLFKRNPIQFPEHIMLSRNYYSTKWTGYRRIKNVIVTLEWIPDTSELTQRDAPSLDYGDLPASEALASVRRTLSMLLQHQSNGSNNVSEDTIKSFILTALQFADAQATPEWTEVLTSLRPLLYLEKEELYPAIMAILNSNALRHEQDGRHTVAVTLAEAETLRRILHFRKARKASIIEGSRTEFALHVVPGGNALLDRTYTFVDAPSPYQRMKHFQCLRYFDGDLQYSDAEVGLLLRALHVNTQGARKLFFHQTISCRRRARQRWDRSPIATVFLLQTALVLLHQRTVGLCMHKDVVEHHDLAIPDAFLAFNSSASGVLSPEELWGAMRFCRLDLTAEDVLDFIDIADAQREGTIQYPDFLYMLSGSRDTEDDTEEQQAKNLPNVVPYGTQEICDAQNARNLRLRMEEEISSQALADEERRVMDEIEHENIRVEMNILQTFPNPRLEAKQLTFDLSSETQVAQLTSTVGGVVARQAPGKCPGEIASAVLCNDAAIRCSLRGLLNVLQPDEFNGALKAVEAFTITSEFCFPKLASYESTRRDLYLLAGTTVTLAQWQLPYYSYTKGSSRPAIEVPIEAQLKARKQETSSAEELLAAEEEEANQNSSKTPLTMIFSSPIPSIDNFLGYLTAEASQFVVMANVKRQSITANEAHYEYGLLDDNRFPKGWICSKSQYEQHVNPLYAKVEIMQDRIVLTVETGDLPGPPYGRIQGTDCDPEANARGSINSYYYDAEEEEVDDDDNVEEAATDENGEAIISSERGRSRVFGDLEDLMFAIRRLRQLNKGDRVRRHPKYWQQEDADGGEGSIGKVVNVHEDTVDVIWPNQNTTSCSWGRAGIFEIIKVPKDTYAMPDRKPDNDERHRDFYNADVIKGAKAGKYPCTGCQERFSIGDLLVCNECTKPIYLCEPCFRDGQHETHDFTAFKSFAQAEVHSSSDDEGSSSSGGSGDDLEKKARRKKAKKDMKRAGSDEAAALRSLLDMSDDDAPADPGAAASKPKFTKVEKPKEEKPKDSNIVTESLHDTVSGTPLAIGVWVRCTARFPPSVKKHHLGFITARPTDSSFTVMFLSEYLNDARVTVKSIQKANLVAVKSYNDPTYGMNTLSSTPAITSVAQSHFQASLWLLTEAVRARSRFEVGNCVKVDSDDSFFGIVASVLPKDRFMVFPLNGSQRYILKASTLTRAYHKGDSVRFLRTVSYPRCGWPNVPIGQRYTAHFRVAGYVSRGTQNILSIEASGVKCEADTGDLEPAVESTWMIYRGQGSKADLLPNSCRIIIDRAHNEGKRFVRFTYGKKLFRVDFPSNQLVLESVEGFAGDVQGSLVRYPPMMWSRPTRVLAVDDGAWHILSVSFSGNSATALCDGKYIPLDIEGHFKEQCNESRCRTDKSLALMQQAKQAPKKKSKAKKRIDDEEDDLGFDLFGDDEDAAPAPPAAASSKREDSITLLEASDDSGDDANTDGKDSNEAADDQPKRQKGPKISELLAVHLSKPIAFFAADTQNTSYRMYTAPHRFVTRLQVSWETNPEATQALHSEAMLNGKWSCTDCGHSNPRTYLTCDECNASRKVHKANTLLNTRPQRRFRYATLRSSDASNLRIKLSNKLRALFQTQLDDIQAALNNEGDKHQENLADAL